MLATTVIGGRIPSSPLVLYLCALTSLVGRSSALRPELGCWHNGVTGTLGPGLGVSSDGTGFGTRPGATDCQPELT